MTLKERINVDYMTAFKAARLTEKSEDVSKYVTTKNLLSVIKGEIQTIEKNTGTESMTDDEVIKIIAKTKKSLDETNSKFPSEQTKTELAIIESYLPKQMSVNEIETKVKQLISEGAENIGTVMKAFTTLPADKKAVGVAFAKFKK
jgi:uncharacterized protein YqeY